MWVPLYVRCLICYPHLYDIVAVSSRPIARGMSSCALGPQFSIVYGPGNTLGIGADSGQWRVFLPLLMLLFCDTNHNLCRRKQWHLQIYGRRCRKSSPTFSTKYCISYRFSAQKANVPRSSYTQYMRDTLTSARVLGRYIIIQQENHQNMYCLLGAG